MKDGFLRVAAATPKIRVADCDYNAEQILDVIKKAPEDTSLLVFPELCITGYTCGDLLFQPALLKGAENAAARILQETAELDMVILVGVPGSLPVGAVQLRGGLPPRTAAGAGAEILPPLLR